MPKSGTTKISEMSEESLRLIEQVERNPALYDADHPFAKDTQHKNFIWELIAEELNYPASVLKKRWSKLSSGYVKNRKDIAAGKAATLKNYDTAYDKALAFLTNKSKGQTRAKSCGELPLTIEEENSIGSELDAKENIPVDTTVLQKYEPGPTPQNTPSEFNYDSTNSCMRILRPRRSEPARSAVTGSLLRGTAAEVLPSATLKKSTVVQRVQNPQTPFASGRKRTRHRSGGITSPLENDCNATLTFFESMALTVALFPPHLQASVKKRICDVVSETEYELSFPATR